MPCSDQKDEIFLSFTSYELVRNDVTCIQKKTASQSSTKKTRIKRVFEVSNFKASF